MAFALIIIIGILFIKYKPVYAVTINGEKIGYIKSKENFEQEINKMLNESEQENVAFVTLENMPEYEFKFVKDIENTDEDKILLSLEEASKTTYTMYAIVLNGEEKTYVNSLEEAEEVVNKVKEEYSNELELDLGIRQIYTEDTKEISSTEIALETVKAEEIKKIEEKKAEEAIKNGNVVNGITLAVKPVSGSITSRYGVASRIRSSAHTGLDIATSSGTPILACASGTVTFSGYKGSYGNLIKISHGNGVETWYAHCSKLLVSTGATIEAGQKIALVGSTGNSTGAHLHLEVRINGNAVNPQNYLYK